jgi:CubicO group peptidase (beta-lactamase class C family)
VDSVFAHYDHTNTPGCALLVARNGQTVYERGYGMASLELGVAITPQTVMDIGSCSKQFTAAAIWLLAAEGRLSLDDEVQRYLPELPRLARPVTLRHLLRHTSGWRDYSDLLSLGGAQDEAVTTASDAMAVLARQRRGNFEPGSWWTYSNTGYFLLGQVVERISGMSMRRFVRERIFTPLGMTRSDIYDDHGRVYPGKAPSYGSGADGWRALYSNWEQTGDGAVQTTVEDLAKWEYNFDNPVVGGGAMVDSMQVTGRLNDGTALVYASGLFVDRYRGLPRVQHGGGWVGYRAMTMRFPSEHTVICLECNAADAVPRSLAESVADVVLDSVLGPSDATLLGDRLSAPSRDVLEGLGGLWWDWTVGRLLRVVVRDGAARLSTIPGGREQTLMQLPDGLLIGTPIVRGAPRYRYDSATRSLWRESPAEPAARFVQVPAAAKPTAAALGDYVGRYECPELPGAWSVQARSDTLWLTPYARPAVALEPLFADAYSDDGQPVQFVRDAARRVTALSLTLRGVRDLRWVRLR